MIGRCTDLQIQFTEAVSAVADQKDLIAKLEHDLSTIQSLSTMHRPDAEGAAIQNLETVPEPIKEATALFYGQPSSASIQIPEGQVDSLLSIISSQRERFRARNHELEAENRLMQHTMQALQSELDNLRADNIKLYEKIKFLQSYPGRGSGSDDTELRYSSQYEERLDPFTSFSRKERQRKYQSLSPWDKATLSLVNPNADIYLLQLVSLHNGSSSHLLGDSACITTTSLALLDPWEESSGQKYQIHFRMI
ncbi:hypothetical protein L345_00570, partial [Ophiophagus hannah]